MYVCEFCGDEVCREFFGEPNSSPHEVSERWTTASFCGHLLLLVWMFLNEANIATNCNIEQFEDQAINRLLIATLEECKDSGTTPKEDVKKTAAIN